MSEHEGDNISISSDELDKIIDESHKMYTALTESKTQLYVFAGIDKIVSEWKNMSESKITPDLYECVFDVNKFKLDKKKDYKFLLLTKFKINNREYKLCIFYEDIQEKDNKYHPFMCKYIVLYIDNKEHTSISLTYNPIKLENFILEENKITVNFDMLELINIFDLLEVEKLNNYDTTKFRDEDFIYHTLDNSY